MADENTTDASANTDQSTNATANTADTTGDQGAGSKDAVLADLARERDKRQEAEKAAKQAARELETLRASSMTDQEKAIAEARKSATNEVLAKANARIVNAEIRAAAAGKLANPSAATKFLDASDFQVDDDGDVDRNAIDKAIDRLLKDEPYLAVPASNRATGSADGGARGTSAASTDMNALLRRAAGR